MTLVGVATAAHLTVPPALAPVWAVMAYSSLLAFLALPTGLKNRLKTAAAPYLYSGPSPTASLATAMAGLDVNDRRGDAVRADLHRKTARVLDHLAELDVYTLNRDGLPVLEVPLADAGDLDAVAQTLWDESIHVTLAAYPLVPRDRVGFRLQVTALNSDEDISRLNATLTRLAARYPLRRRESQDAVSEAGVGGAGR
ncbi:aminotransferase class I/II-fold pyridoxal phosphate-dependent enzyme [Streptomyces davaonensis]|uniref:aminotransferase class I/II-fold pyridoxal phosphate-dependent enzyme n=1 Tax=Streptomyces davaonensis TaxID=348043 RepID=UPI00034D376D|nr:aminotransferase class I/II-fold pyridoxal phosphate-dependent enzyme [Streptomyces davaonensis]